MADLLERGLYLGLGVFTLTKERAEQVIEDLVERGKVSKDDSAKAVRDLLERADEEKGHWSEQIDESLKRAVKELHLASKEDIDKKLDKILQELKKTS